MKNVVYSLLVLFFFTGCVKNNPDPSWLEVTEWVVHANPNLQGAEGQITENVSDAWVYVNDELIGVFEVPFKIPLLVSGDAKVQLYPTVLNNGISATKKRYPFLKPHTENVQLIQNGTVTINPQTEYYEGLHFWIEDFESASVDIEDDPNSSVQIQINDDAAIIQPFNGNAFGRVSLSSAADNWTAYTTGNLVLPLGKEVYLEIDYHNTNEVVTGLLSVSNNGTKENPNIQLNQQEPSEVKWKKIYIDLREIVAGSTNANYFEVTFQSLLGDDETSGQINIDNIKVVHF